MAKNGGTFVACVNEKISLSFSSRAPIADLSQTAGIPFKSVSQPRRTTAVQICTRNKLTLFTAEDAPCIAVAAVGDAVRGRRVVGGGEGGCKRQRAQNEEADPGPKRLSRSTNHRAVVFGDRPSVPHHTKKRQRRLRRRRPHRPTYAISNVPTERNKGV